MLTLEADRTALAALTQCIKGGQIVPVSQKKGDMFQSYSGYLHNLNGKYEEMCAFLGIVTKVNMGHSFRMFKPVFPTFPSAEIAVTSPQEIRETLEDGSMQAARVFTSCFQMLMDSLVAQQQIGMIRWFDSTVCRYSYYTTERQDERTGKAYMQRTHIKYCNLHDVIDAERIALPVDTKMPAKARTIIGAIPQWLLPMASLVVGDQIASESFEVARKTEMVRDPSYYHDPAVIIGPYVLYAWTEKADPMRKREVKLAGRRPRRQNW
jgi:hypothetical protein